MADNIPLIPDKSSICEDVRAVLREVFSDVDCLPLLTTERTEIDRTRNRDSIGDSLCREEHWADKYMSECQELWQYEKKLKAEHAKRTSREPPPNIYKLSSPAASSEAGGWKTGRGLIQRTDLIPTVEQNAGRDNILWIKNILNRSSCDLSLQAVPNAEVLISPNIKSVKEITPRSYSIGELVVCSTPPVPLAPQPPPQADYIVCIPPQLNFVNFTVGQLHTQSLRLVNVSKIEVRLSLHPPRHRELDVQICGTRGLTVTSGATTELRLHFSPRDTRAVYDELKIRVSIGRSVVVPIACYMQPPILDVLVPNVPSTSLLCTPEEVLNDIALCGGDVLELGAKLLGDVHQVQLVLYCKSDHAAFFMITEDAWTSFCLDNLTSSGSLQADPFTIQPACWRGGGSVKGLVWCRAIVPGLQATALRVLSSTAIARPLHLLADSLHFRTDHVTLEAQEKDYDICSDDDPACKYYVHLGTAFPHQSLTATVQLVNHSPISYSYYWSARPWGVSACSEDEKVEKDASSSEEKSECFCIGDMELERTGEQKRSKYQTAASVHAEPTHSTVAARSSCAVHVCAPNVGKQIGTQRAVLMLVLKDVPKESFPPDYIIDAIIVRTNKVQSDPIPGVKSWCREICEVVCCQLEVWWEVVPAVFFLEPNCISLPHSRRMQNIDLKIRATQLYGCEPISTVWELPTRLQLPTPLTRLSLTNAVDKVFNYTLPSLSSEYPEIDEIALVATEHEWRSKSTIVRYSAIRHPRLEPARLWLGVVPPGARLHAKIIVVNDTYQQISWWCKSWRWWAENTSPGCTDRESCEQCREQICSCALLRPTRGDLEHGQEALINYQVNAPNKDGCFATLVQIGHDAAVDCSGARAVLVAFRVLAARLMLSVAPCHSGRCCLDLGAVKRSSGTVVLRPSVALVCGIQTCYRLLVTNLTPISTRVSWEPPIESGDILNVMFTPKDFQIRSHEQVEVKVVLGALKVCSRRIFLLRAQVEHASKPLYLVIDAAIDGVQASCEIPSSGQLTTGSVVMKRTQVT